MRLAFCLWDGCHEVTVPGAVMVSAGFVHLLGTAIKELDPMDTFPLAPFLCGPQHVCASMHAARFHVQHAYAVCRHTHCLLSLCM